MTDRYGFDTASVDLGKICRVVYSKRYYNRYELISGNGKLEEIIRTVSNCNQLQHQRRSSENGNDKTGYVGYYLAFAAICEEPTDDDYNTIINVAKQYGITSGRITFVDEFSVIMGKRSWPEDTINEPNPSSTPSTEAVGGTEE